MMQDALNIFNIKKFDVHENNYCEYKLKKCQNEGKQLKLYNISFRFISIYFIK